MTLVNKTTDHWIKAFEWCCENLEEGDFWLTDDIIQGTNLEFYKGWIKDFKKSKKDLEDFGVNTQDTKVKDNSFCFKSKFHAFQFKLIWG